MKYFLALFSASLFFFSSVGQNNFYVGGSAAYLLNGKVQFVEGLVDIGNQFGADGSIGVIVNKDFGFELNYSGAYDCDLAFRSYSFTDHEDFFTKINIHSISVNFLKYFDNETPILPFISVGSGTSIFDVKSDGADDPVRFALNGGFGTNIRISQYVSARIRVRYFAPLIFEGSGIHAGIGTGGSYLGMSIDASAPLAQLNMDAGIVIRLPLY